MKTRRRFGWSFAALLLVAIQTAFQFQRIKDEERVLTTAFLGYADYKKRTRRLLPGIY